MREMGFMEKLLDGVGVEWKALGGLVKTVTAPSKLKSQAYCTEGKLPIIDQGIDYIAGYTDEDVSAVEAGKYVIFGDHSEHIKYVDFSFVQGADGIKILRPISSNPKYLYYAFENFYKKEMSYKRHWSTAKETLIPIPYPENPKKSLEIQAEIVRILDAMTAHTAELTAELTTRKKQYNYYRDKLLSFEDGEVEWKELGEICRFINGRAYKQPELLDSGKYPVLRVGNFFTNGNWYYSDLELDPDKYCDKGDLLYAWSASFGPRIWEGGKVIYHYHIWKILPDLNLVSKKYLYYLLAWDTEALKAESGTGSTMMHIGKGSIEKRLVPVPSLKKQAQIVSFLDKFDALTASITEGLPREIELREKQYAYYRDLLLSFPQAQAA